jgi:hypothetical protein
MTTTADSDIVERIRTALELLDLPVSAEAYQQTGHLLRNWLNNTERGARYSKDPVAAGWGVRGVAVLHNVNDAKNGLSAPLPALGSTDVPRKLSDARAYLREALDVATGRKQPAPREPRA